MSELYDSLKEYISGDGNSFTLRAEGWTKLLHSLFDGPLAADLGLRPVKDRVWADDYRDGKRRVVSLFPVNDTFSTLKWGWNFEFIPRQSGKKLIWCRTDRSIYAHTFRVSEDFYKNVVPGRKRPSVFGRSVLPGSNDEAGFQHLVAEHLDAMAVIRDEMRSYYERTSDYAGLLAELGAITCEKYYNFIWPENQIVRPFIEKYLGMDEKAEDDFLKIAFKDDAIRKEYYQRFRDLGKLPAGNKG